MTFGSMTHAAAFAVLFTAGMTAGGTAPTRASDSRQPYTILAQAPQSPLPGEAEDGQDGDSGPPGMMPYEMMDGRMDGGMHGPMMKMMFAIADTNGDGMLTFEEIMALHKRIFDAMDANKDGKLTLEEIQTFMQD